MWNLGGAWERVAGHAAYCDDTPCADYVQALDLGPGHAVRGNVSLPRGAFTVAFWTRNVTDEGGDAAPLFSVDPQRHLGAQCFDVTVVDSRVVVTGCGDTALRATTLFVPELALRWWVHLTFVYYDSTLAVSANGKVVLTQAWPTSSGADATSVLMLGGNATNIHRGVWRFAQVGVTAGQVLPKSLMECASAPSDTQYGYVEVEGKVPLTASLTLRGVSLPACWEACHTTYAPHSFNCGGLQHRDGMCFLFAAAELEACTASTAVIHSQKLYVPRSARHKFSFEGTTTAETSALTLSPVEFSTSGHNGGYAARFQSGTSANVAQSTAHTGCHSWTVSTWAMVDNAAASGRALFTLGDRANTTAIWVTVSSTSLYFYWATSHGWEQWNTGITVAYDTWTFYQIGYDGKRVFAHAGCNEYASREVDLVGTGSLGLGWAYSAGQYEAGTLLLDDFTLHGHFTRSCAVPDAPSTHTPFSYRLVNVETQFDNAEVLSVYPPQKLVGDSPFSLSVQLQYVVGDATRCHVALGSDVLSDFALCTESGYHVLRFGGTEYRAAYFAGDTAWHAVEVRYDGDTVHMSIDGERLAELSVSMSLTANDKVRVAHRRASSTAAGDRGTFRYRQIELKHSYTPLRAVEALTHFAALPPYQKVARFAFEGGTKDSIGSTNLTASATLAYTTQSRQGKHALLLSPASPSLTMESSAGTNVPTQGMTVGLWVRVATKVKDGNVSLVSFEEGGWSLVVSDARDVVVSFAGSSATSSVDVGDSRWHCVRVVVAADTLLLYVDDAAPAVLRFAENTADVGAMRVNSGLTVLTVFLDDLRIYRGTAPAEEWYSTAALHTGADLSTSSEWHTCAAEGQVCHCDTEVRFGSGRNWVYGEVRTGEGFVACSAEGVAALSGGAHAAASFARKFVRCSVTSANVVNGTLPFDTIEECEGSCGVDARCLFCASHCESPHYHREYYMLRSCDEATPEYIGGGSSCYGGSSAKTATQPSQYTAQCQCRSPTWKRCATEGNLCTCNGSVKYGSHVGFRYSRPENNQILCSEAVFGAVLGSPGASGEWSTESACYCAGTSFYEREWEELAGWGCTQNDTASRYVRSDEASCKQLCRPDTCTGVTFSEGSAECQVHSSSSSCFPQYTGGNVSTHIWKPLFAKQGEEATWGAVPRCTAQPFVSTARYDVADCEGYCETELLCRFVTFDTDTGLCSLYETCASTSLDTTQYSSAKLFHHTRPAHKVASWDVSDCLRDDSTFAVTACPNTAPMHDHEAYTYTMQVLCVTGYDHPLFTLGEHTFTLSPDGGISTPGGNFSGGMLVGQWATLRVVVEGDALKLYAGTALVHSRSMLLHAPRWDSLVVHTGPETTRLFRVAEVTLFRGVATPSHGAQMLLRSTFDVEDRSSPFTLITGAPKVVATARTGTSALEMTAGDKIRLDMKNVVLSAEEPFTAGLWVMRGAAVLTVQCQVSSFAASIDTNVAVASNKNLTLSALTDSGAWNLLTVTNNGSTVRHYLNGDLVRETESTAAGTCSALYVHATGANIRTLVDDVRVYRGEVAAGSWHAHNAPQLLARYPLEGNLSDVSMADFFAPALAGSQVVYSDTTAVHSYTHNRFTALEVQASTLGYSSESARVGFLGSPLLGMTVGGWARCVADCDDGVLSLLFGLSSGTQKLGVGLANGRTHAGEQAAFATLFLGDEYVNSTHTTANSVDVTSWALYRLVLGEGFVKVYADGKLAVKAPLSAPFADNVGRQNVSLVFGEVIHAATLLLHDVRVYSGVAGDVEWLRHLPETETITAEIGSHHDSGSDDTVTVDVQGCSSTVIEDTMPGDVLSRHVFCPNGAPASVTTRSTLGVRDAVEIASLVSSSGVFETTSLSSADASAGWLGAARVEAVWRDPTRLPCSRVHVGSAWTEVASVSDPGITNDHHFTQVVLTPLSAYEANVTNLTAFGLHIDSDVARIGDTSVKIVPPFRNFQTYSRYDAYERYDASVERNERTMWQAKSNVYIPQTASFWLRAERLPSVSQNSSGVKFTARDCGASFVVKLRTDAAGVTSLLASGLSCTRFAEVSYAGVLPQHWHKVEIHWPTQAYVPRGYGDAAVYRIHLDGKEVMKLPLEARSPLLHVSAVGYPGPAVHIDGFRTCAAECHMLRSATLPLAQLTPCVASVQEWSVDCGGNTLYLGGALFTDKVRCSTAANFTHHAEGTHCFRTEGGVQTHTRAVFGGRAAGGALSRDTLRCFGGAGLDLMGQAKVGTVLRISARSGCSDAAHCGGRGEAYYHYGSCACRCAGAYRGRFCEVLRSAALPAGHPRGQQLLVDFEDTPVLVEEEDVRPRVYCSWLLSGHTCSAANVTASYSNVSASDCYDLYMQNTSSALEYNRRTATCSIVSGLVEPTPSIQHDCYRVDSTEACLVPELAPQYADSEEACEALCRGGCRAWWYNSDDGQCLTTEHAYGFTAHLGTTTHTRLYQATNRITNEPITTTAPPRRATGHACPMGACISQAGVVAEYSSPEVTVSLWRKCHAKECRYLSFAPGVQQYRTCTWEHHSGAMLQAGYDLGAAYSMHDCRAKCDRDDCEAVSLRHGRCVGSPAGSTYTLLATNDSVAMTTQSANCTHTHGTSGRTCSFTRQPGYKLDLLPGAGYIGLGQASYEDDCESRCEASVECVAWTMTEETCYGVTSMAGVTLLHSENVTAGVAASCTHTAQTGYDAPAGSTLLGVHFHAERVELLRSTGDAVEQHRLPKAALNEWVHVTVRVAERDWSVLYNGVVVTSFTTLHAFAEYANALDSRVVVGGAGSAVDDLQLWSTSLPDEVVRTTLYGRVPIPQPMPAGWHLLTQIPMDGLRPAAPSHCAWGTATLRHWDALQWTQNDVAPMSVEFLLSEHEGDTARVAVSGPPYQLVAEGAHCNGADNVNGDLDATLTLRRAAGALQLLVNGVVVCWVALHDDVQIHTTQHLDGLRACVPGTTTTASLAEPHLSGDGYSAGHFAADMLQTDDIVRLRCDGISSVHTAYFTGVTADSFTPGAVFPASATCAADTDFTQNVLHGASCSHYGYTLTTDGVVRAARCGTENTTVAHPSAEVSFKPAATERTCPPQYCGQGGYEVAWEEGRCRCVCREGFVGESCGMCSFGARWWPYCGAQVVAVGGQSTARTVGLSVVGTEVSLRGVLHGVASVALSARCVSSDSHLWLPLHHSGDEATATLHTTPPLGLTSLCALRTDGSVFKVAPVRFVECVNGAAKGASCECHADSERGYWGGRTCAQCKGGYKGMGKKSEKCEKKTVEIAQLWQHNRDNYTTPTIYQN